MAPANREVNSNPGSKEYKMRGLVLSLIALATLTLLALPALAGYGQVKETKCSEITSKVGRLDEAIANEGEENDEKPSSSVISD